MPRITDIKPQRRPQFYSVFVDGRFSFGLSDLELSNSGLRVDQELSATEIENWQAVAGQSKAMAAALRYLAIRPRSTHELRQYLQRKDFADSEVETAVERLIGLGYLDDADFARRWLGYRQSNSPRSELQLRQELRQKGIGTEIVDELLGRSPESDETALRSVIDKKAHCYSDEQKLIAYLMRQGFRLSQIKQVLQELKN